MTRRARRSISAPQSDRITDPRVGPQRARRPARPSRAGHAPRSRVGHVAGDERTAHLRSMERRRRQPRHRTGTSHIADSALTTRKVRPNTARPVDSDLLDAPPGASCRRSRTPVGRAIRRRFRTPRQPFLHPVVDRSAVLSGVGEPSIGATLSRSPDSVWARRTGHSVLTRVPDVHPSAVCTTGGPGELGSASALGCDSAELPLGTCRPRRAGDRTTCADVRHPRIPGDRDGAARSPAEGVPDTAVAAAGEAPGEVAPHRGSVNRHIIRRGRDESATGARAFGNEGFPVIRTRLAGVVPVVCRRCLVGRLELEAETLGGEPPVREPVWYVVVT